VTVPDYFYKVILDIHPPEYKAIAFLMKNEKSNRPLLDFAISVDSLERFTGLDFFPMLPDTLEKRLQNMKNHEIWFE
jgi:endonuclease G, mitochondrial